METVAVYWEKQIRIYGVHERSSLLLAQLTLPQNQLAQWGRQLVLLGQPGRFELVQLEAAPAGAVTVQLLIDPGREQDLPAGLQRVIEQQPDWRLELFEPVALVYFHGPHFQDRFGIAAAGWNLLAGCAITPLAFVCSGTSVSIVCAEAEKDRLIVAVRAAFPIPQQAG